MKVRSAKILTPAASKCTSKTASPASDRTNRRRGVLRITERPATRETVLCVRTAAGPTLGFGHLRRTLLLARMLRPHVSPLFLLDPDDLHSREQVARAEFAYEAFKPGEPWPGHISPSAILIDTRIRKGVARMISEARRRAIPVVSIHDLGLMPVASDLAIDGSIRPFATGKRHERTKYCAGLSYLVLDPVYALSRRPARPIRRHIGKVVINLGGGDSGRYFRRVLEGLRWTGLNLDVVGIPGFVCWGQEELARECWHPLRFRWAEKNEPIAELMLCADLAVTAGGLSAYEALCVGTPLCALSYDRKQRMAVRALAESGLCLDLGYGESLTPARFSFHWRRLAGDPKLRRTLAEKGRRAVDGRGAQRVCRLLRSIMMSRSTENDSVKSR
jgi:spore coat polysaccharide biosynthesis predicted glycosyltransferase SpsG